MTKICRIYTILMMLNDIRNFFTTKIKIRKKEDIEKNSKFNLSKKIFISGKYFNTFCSPIFCKPDMLSLVSPAIILIIPTLE